MENQTYRDFANFNSFTVTGRILDIKLLVNKKGNDFIAVTVITHGLNDDEGMTVTFNDSTGLMSLHKDGFLPKGRMVTVVGHISTVTETYEKDGQIQMLKRPEIRLLDVTIPTGGLGPLPKSATPAARKTGVVVKPSDANQAAPAVDKAPMPF